MLVAINVQFCFVCLWNILNISMNFQYLLRSYVKKNFFRNIIDMNMKIEAELFIHQ